MAAPLYRIQVEDRQLKVLLNTAQLQLTPAQEARVGHALRDAAENVRTRAVHNVSGYPVQYDGRVFRVNTVTGALKGSIEMQWPYLDTLAARVYVNGTITGTPVEGGPRLSKPVPVARYAAAIEYGHFEIDLKRTMLGKIVPFFAARSSNATGPYAARGLVGVKGQPGMFHSVAHDNRLRAKGKGPMFFRRVEAVNPYTKSGGGGSYFIAFRRVGKTGWIIPAAKPRPFMRAALSNTRNETRQIIGDALTRLLEDS